MGSDPYVDRLLEWRKDPSARATIALCDDLRVRPSKTLVGFVAKVVARRHWHDAEVVRALGRLQLAAGLHSQSRLTFVRAARLDYLSNPNGLPAAARPDPPPPASSGTIARAMKDLKESALQESELPPSSGDSPTSDHTPPQFLLDLLRGIDDDDAIASVAQTKHPTPAGSRRRASADRIAALGVPLVDSPVRADATVHGPETRSSEPVT